LVKPSSFALSRSFAFGLGLCSAALVSGRADADIYTYTDAQGNVHISTQPAAGGKGGKMERIAGNGHKSKNAADLFTISMPSDNSPDRFNRYDAWIREGARLYRIPEELVRAVIKCESDFDPRAVSPTGAQGLMQLMPATALRMQVRDAFDPRENILGGTRYLRVLANTFSGDLELTVAGYNAGEAAVLRYRGIPPYEETQGYVGCVVSHYRTYKAARMPAAKAEQAPAEPSRKQ